MWKVIRFLTTTLFGGLQSVAIGYSVAHHHWLLVGVLVPAWVIALLGFFLWSMASFWDRDAEIRKQKENK